MYTVTTHNQPYDVISQKVITMATDAEFISMLQHQTRVSSIQAIGAPKSLANLSPTQQPTAAPTVIEGVGLKSSNLAMDAGLTIGIAIAFLVAGVLVRHQYTDSTLFGDTRGSARGSGKGSDVTGLMSGGSSHGNGTADRSYAFTPVSSTGDAIDQPVKRGGERGSVGYDDDMDSSDTGLAMNPLRPR
jgi:hypothetical protein